MKFYLVQFLKEEVIKKIPKQKLYIMTKQHKIIEATVSLKKALVKVKNHDIL